jgi:hypothetical protein
MRCAAEIGDVGGHGGNAGLKGGDGDGEGLGFADVVDGRINPSDQHGEGLGLGGHGPVLPGEGPHDETDGGEESGAEDGDDGADEGSVDGLIVGSTGGGACGAGAGPTGSVVVISGSGAAPFRAEVALLTPKMAVR